jgi:hypothetical protein
MHIDMPLLLLSEKCKYYGTSDGCLERSGKRGIMAEKTVL